MILVLWRFFLGGGKCLYYFLEACLGGYVIELVGRNIEGINFSADKKCMLMKNLNGRHDET